MSEVKKIYIVGAGAMGAGIAQVAALAGYTVVIRDLTQQIADEAVNKIKRNLQKLAEKGKITQEQAGAVRLSATEDLAAAADADLVIEAISENIVLKQETFAALENICKPEAVLASNTSSISITEIASATKCPERVIGMHFFNPVPVMKLLELVMGYRTSQETLAVVREIGEKMGKVTIVTQDKAGFVVSRCLDVMMNEAVWTLEEGVATAED
ncbi:MAG: 3-hydroxyacyl-CoA dehydrogenase family protein, partial [Sporomusa sp.]